MVEGLENPNHQTITSPVSLRLSGIVQKGIGEIEQIS